MQTFKIGDTVKIVDLHKQDAYYGGPSNFIGAFAIIKRLNQSDAPEGFVSGDFEIGEDTRCFFAVKLELVEAFKHPTHLSCKRYFKGETHFSAKLFFSDGTHGVLFGFQYGYGDQCIHDSVKLMKLCEFLPKSADATFNSHQDLIDAGISYEITDVTRKGDL